MGDTLQGEKVADTVSFDTVPTVQTTAFNFLLDITDSTFTLGSHDGVLELARPSTTTG